MNFMHRNFGLFLIFGSSFYCVSGCVSFFHFLSISRFRVIVTYFFSLQWCNDWVMLNGICYMKWKSQETKLESIFTGWFWILIGQIFSVAVYFIFISQKVTQKWRLRRDSKTIVCIDTFFSHVTVENLLKVIYSVSHKMQMHHWRNWICSGTLNPNNICFMIFFKPMLVCI